MTKQPSDETALKCHLTIETNKGVQSNALVICDAEANPKLGEKIEVTPTRTRIKLKRSELGSTMAELYDLEESFETEKPVKICLDLDLYQMEKV